VLSGDAGLRLVILGKSSLEVGGGLHKNGARSARNERTFDTYDRVDDLAYRAFTTRSRLPATDTVTSPICCAATFGSVESTVRRRSSRDYYLAQFPGELLTSFSGWSGASADGLEWIATSQANARPFPGKVERGSREFADLTETARALIVGCRENHAPLVSDRGFTLLGKWLELDEVV
jgi:hypothetical protein